MRYSVSGPAMIAALSMVQGCTVSDTLTPPLDVGTSGSISNSAPLNQTDMQTAIAQNQGVQNQGVSSSAMGGQTEASYSYPQQPIEDGQPSPQNSLEAQAQALQNGYNPVASKPLGDNPGWQEHSQHHGGTRQPVENHRILNEQSQTRQAPVYGGQEAQAPASSQAANPAPESAQQAALAPDPASANAIRFLPIIGAPSQVVMPLSRQLGMEAREKGLVLRDSSNEPAQHILKGYFSAYNDGGKTVVVYVWDVLDASGNRLHRIQGQETVPGKAKDPWASVPASTMQNIATKTMDDYQEWRTKSAG